MASLDVFNQDPFTTIQLTTAVDRVPYLPMTLGAMGIFDPKPIRTKTLMVEQRQGKLVLVPFSDRGAPGVQRTTEMRSARHFEVPRIRTDDTIYADELAAIRAFGSETEMMQVQKELARRLVGPTGLRSNIEYTRENHRLAAVQGLLLDADGTTKFNWFNEFGITPAGEIEFNLLTKVKGTLRPLLNQMVRNMKRAAQGAWIEGRTRAACLCGDAFFDALITHPDVEQTYLNWSAARELRENLAFEVYNWGGVDWINYRGSDDTTGLVAGATNGSANLTGIAVVTAMAGDQISGPGIPAGTTLSSVNPSASTAVMSANFTGTTGTIVVSLGTGNANTGGGTIGIPSNKAKFFPRFAPGIFEVAYAPGESFEWINTLGKPEYVRMIPDRDRNEWVKAEMTSYPLHICTRPEILQTGTMDNSLD